MFMSKTVKTTDVDKTCFTRFKESVERYFSLLERCYNIFDFRSMSVTRSVLACMNRMHYDVYNMKMTCKI